MRVKVRKNRKEKISVTGRVKKDERGKSTKTALAGFWREEDSLQTRDSVRKGSWGRGYSVMRTPLCELC